MWKKKDEGGFKPLWVNCKCGCGKWNAVQVGAVVKYLEKMLATPSDARKAQPEPKTTQEDD